MRLYRLMERAGSVRKGISPWFEPPKAGEPAVVPGWCWDAEEKMWVKIPVDKIKVSVPRVEVPRPTRPPGPAISDEVEGWKWSDSMREWVETPMGTVRVQREIERPAPPIGPAGPGTPDKVPGWEWSDSMQGWIEVPLRAERVQREEPRPAAPIFVPWSLRNTTYRCWKWLTRWNRWKFVPLTTMEVKKGLKCDPEPVLTPGWDYEEVVVGWSWSTAQNAWVEEPMPLEWLELEEERVSKPSYPPSPPVPWRVTGWVWSSGESKWIEGSLPLEWVEVEKERPPMPKYPPGPAVSMRMPGWHWDRDIGEWVGVIVATEVVEFEPPRLLPPGTVVTEASALAAGQTHLTLMIDKFMAMGLPFEQAFDLATRINTVTVRHVVLSPSGEYVKLWDGFADLYRSPEMPLLHQVYLAVYLAAVAMFVTSLLDELEDILMMPAAVDVLMEPTVETFLLGPDRWYYGRHIGTSAKGHLYYSCCDEACPVTAVHLRGPAGTKFDSVVFPDGFLEEGWKAGRFVKYEWERWIIKYYGFLVRIGANIFRLKRAELEPGAPPFIVFMLPDDQWCIDFRTYL